MSGPKCNLPEAKRAEAEGLFDFPYLEELIRAKRAFRKYIFFDTWGRRGFREVFCPECGRFDIEKAEAMDIYGFNFFDFHHGEMTNCPMCGAEGILISLGKMRTMSSLTETRKAVILRAAGSALIAMAGTFRMEYSHNDLDPYPWWSGEKHYWFDGKLRMEWRKDEAGHFDKGKWVKEQTVWRATKTVTEPFPDGYNMGGGYLDGSYIVIGAEEIEKTSFRYSMVTDFFAGRGGLFDIYGEGPRPVRGVIPYLAEYTRRPQMEMLVKLDHEDVVEDLLQGNPHAATLDWKAKTPERFFRMSKAEYREFRAAGGKVCDLEAWKRVMPGADFREYIRLHRIFGMNLGRFLNMFGEDPRREKIVRWYERQASHCAEIWGVWQDLLNLEAELGNDVTHDDVIMPEDLRRRHDEATDIRNRMARRDARKKYGARFRQLKKRYAYTDGELSIVVPTCAEEIENEGAALNHCVAGYADRHIKGVKTILFLRWSDDIRTPYMTIEIEPKGTGIRIVQIHGYRNEYNQGVMKPGDIHQGFLDEWTEWVAQGSMRTNTGKPIRPRTEEDKGAKTA